MNTSFQWIHKGKRESHAIDVLTNLTHSWMVYLQINPSNLHPWTDRYQDKQRERRKSIVQRFIISKTESMIGTRPFASLRWTLPVPIEQSQSAAVVDYWTSSCSRDARAWSTHVQKTGCVLREYPRRLYIELARVRRCPESRTRQMTCRSMQAKNHSTWDGFALLE